MTPIKAILIAAILGLLAWTLRYRARVGIRAGIKIAAVVLAVVGAAAVVDPALTQDLANIVGVTRGTDLMLYVLVVVFAFSYTSMYLRFKEHEARLAKIVRAQAIFEAVVTGGAPTGATTTGGPATGGSATGGPATHGPPFHATQSTDDGGAA